MEGTSHVNIHHTDHYLTHRPTRVAASAIAMGAMLMGASVLPAQATTAVPARSSATSSASTRSLPGRIPASTYPFVTSLEGLRGRTFELAWATNMIMHHSAGIRLSRYEVDKGADGSVKKMAASDAAEQAKQVAEMTRWLKDWYGVSPQQAMAKLPPRVRAEINRMMRDVLAQVAAVQHAAPGEATDRAFRVNMTPHHEMAIIDSQIVLSHAVHRQLRELAKDIITGQQQDVFVMTEDLTDPPAGSR